MKWGALPVLTLAAWLDDLIKMAAANLHSLQCHQLLNQALETALLGGP